MKTLTCVAALALAACVMTGCGDRGAASADMVSGFRTAASSGDAVAQYNLGMCYARGVGVSQDMAEAVKWFRLSADQGHAAAQYELGACYLRGEGVPRDAAEAAKWFRLAADQGNQLAQEALKRLGGDVKAP